MQLSSMETHMKLLTLSFICALLSKAEAADAVFSRHLPARVLSSAGLQVPENQRAPFGWTTATMTGADKAPLELAWPELPADVRPTHLRIAIGLDERDEKTAEVFLPKSGRLVGTLDLRFVTQFQVYQLALSSTDVKDIRAEGVAMRLTKGTDLEVFTGGENVPAALLPHLFVPGTASPMEEYFARMNSLACVQQFGWMEGCVMDGLIDLGALPQHTAMRATAQQHLALFFKDGQFIYENHLSAPSDGRIYGIEGGLPFAALAKLEPDNPLLELPLKAWEHRRRSNGSIQDGEHMSSEGAYTIAYPLALIAKARGDEAMMQDALYQCRIRQARFFDGKEFWRTYNDDGKRGNRNWARGIAWQMVGLTRTLEVAKDRRDIADLIIHLQRMADWVIKLQRDDGLWSVFADEKQLTPDTAGSAGIAAALALGAKNGWLDENAKAAAQKTLAGLQTHLTPDGFLGGVTQSNKGGEALQRSDYRSIYQMGMGLMAQLIAALEKNPVTHSRSHEGNLDE
jgi:unsaturated rhamnogalacturonyl hydrolase